MDYHTFIVDLIEGFFKLFRIPNKDSKPTHFVSRTSKPLTASRLRSLSPVYGSQVKKNICQNISIIASATILLVKYGQFQLSLEQMGVVGFESRHVEGFFHRSSYSIDNHLRVFNTIYNCIYQCHFSIKFFQLC